jgi:SAM-dependent methyltransferase
MPSEGIALDDATLGFTSIADKERRDIEAKRALVAGSAGTLEMVHFRALKAGEVPLFRRFFERYAELFGTARSIVELGGGWGWASYYVKARLPGARVVTTDIAWPIVERHREWEDFFHCRIDGGHCARSYDLPFEDGSIDLAFCFQAAHHFGRHRRTLRELHRVLAPGGAALYLDEPVCGRMLYKLAHRRLNRRLEDDGVPEDVLIHGRILELAREAGFVARLDFDLHCVNRGPGPTLYYALLRGLGPLRYVLPAAASFVFVKPDE